METVDTEKLIKDVVTMHNFYRDIRDKAQAEGNTLLAEEITENITNKLSDIFGVLVDVDFFILQNEDRLI